MRKITDHITEAKMVYIFLMHYFKEINNKLKN